MKAWTDLSSIFKPPRIRSLATDPRGYPVPYFAATDSGGHPDFRVVDQDRWQLAVRFRRCGICGDQLGQNVAFVGGPASIESRLFTDLPMHIDCAGYAMQSCPFLAAPSFSYLRSDTVPDGINTRINQAVSTHRPLMFGLAVTRAFETVFLPDLTLALSASPFKSVTWWQNGTPLAK